MLCVVKMSFCTVNRAVIRLSEYAAWNIHQHFDDITSSKASYGERQLRADGRVHGFTVGICCGCHGNMHCVFDVTAASTTLNLPASRIRPAALTVTLSDGFSR